MNFIKQISTYLQIRNSKYNVKGHITFIGGDYFISEEGLNINAKILYNEYSIKIHNKSVIKNCPEEYENKGLLAYFITRNLEKKYIISR